MKNVLSLVIALFTLVSGFSQLSFDKDSTSLVMADGVANKAGIMVSNNSGHDIALRWTLINSTMNDNTSGDISNHWKFQFCECNTCHTNDFDPITSGDACADPMTDGQSVEWYITVDPNGQAMDKGEWVIAVQNITDGITDTLSFYALNPLAVNEITANADVTSYPNPANSELIVNYELTNVVSPEVNVYNIIGAKVGTYTINNTNGVLNIDTQELENGMYFFTIEENNTRVFTQRFNVVH